MTESEWKASTDSAAMLAKITAVSPRVNPLGKPLSDRKLRLFACACCRQAWGRLNDPRLRRAAEVAEEYADDETTKRRIQHWRRVYDFSNSVEPAEWGWLLIHNAVRDDLHHVGESIQNTYRYVPPATQAALLRCLLGNPWRVDKDQHVPYHNLTPILAWNGGTIPLLARTIYAERDFSPDRLGVLADALEQAGCVGEECEACRGEGKRMYCKQCRGLWIYAKERNCPECGWKTQERVRCEVRACQSCHGTGRLPHPLLAHLRDGGLHARGCHAIDVLLGKS